MAAGRILTREQNLRHNCESVFPKYSFPFMEQCCVEYVAFSINKPFNSGHNQH